ncbi:unnamed protein product [Rhodiola kirilowii]
MVLKRLTNERGNDEPESSRRRLSLTELCSFTQEEIQSVFEPFFQITVREAVEKSFHVLFPLQRCVSSRNHDEAGRSWMLRFVKQLPPIFFTGNKIVGEDGAPLQVEIVDVDSKNIVTAAPMSSLKLEIVVLDGDFDVGPQSDPGEKYFNSHIVRAREGKKPLMIGEIHILLKDGVGFLRDVCITDNSRWTRSAQFRLGVRVLQSSSKGFRVREAVSGAFKVKDRRGEACMKHVCPSIYDEVWRLKMIRKNGKYHKRLESIGITTIGKFLQVLDANPLLVKQTLRCGNSNRIMDTIIKHATACLDKGHQEDQNLPPKVACSLNQNLGVGVFDDRPHSRTSSLMHCFQQVADDLEGYISNNGINQVPVDGNLQSEPSTYPSLLQCLDIPIAYSDQQGHELAPFVSSSSNCIEMVDQMEDPILNQTIFDPPQVNNFLASPSTRDCWIADVHQISDEYPFQTETPYLLSNALPLSQFSGTFSAAINESDLAFLSSFLPRNGSPKTAWCKLRAL